MRQMMISVLAVTSLIIIFAADLTLWPGHNLPVLYAIPVLIAAVRAPPLFVYLISGLSTTTDLLSFDLEVLQPHNPLGLWPLRFLAFLIVAALAVLYARERYRLQDTRVSLEQTVSCLNTVLDATDNGIIMYDRHFIIRLMNDKLADWLAVSPTEFIGRSLDELLREVVASEVAAPAEYLAGFALRHAHPESVIRDEVVQVRPTYHVFRFYSGPVYHGGHLIGRIGVYTDITAQRREEEEREALGRVAQALVREQTLEQVGALIAEEAQQTLRTKAVEVWLLDQSSNEARLLAQRGLSEQTVDELRVLPLAPLKVLQQVVNAAQAIEVDDFSKLPAYLAVLRKAAEREGWRSALFQPLVAHGDVVGVLVYIAGNLHHFTSRERALAGGFGDLFAVAIEHARLFEDALNHAREAEDARKHLQLFLSMVVHDLRGPVTVILGYSQRLLHEPEQLSEREQRGLRAIESAANRMRRLLGDLLDAARIGAGRFRIHPERINLVDVVSMAIQQEQETTTHHQIHLASPAEVIGVWDAERIAQVFDNLLSNAIKYSPRGGEIAVSLGCEEDKVKICVTDQGIGLEPEQIEHLFQPFSRLRTEGGIEGAGLGLYITKGIVDAHGGRIWVESEPGKGSTFCVCLPRDARGRTNLE